jgi:transcription antitermination factor NusG
VGDGAKLYLERGMGLSSVTLATTVQRKDFNGSALPASYLELHWYAVYTCANHEARVAAEIKVRDIEHFLPVYESVRRWKDRRVSLHLPLFPGYVFVRLALRDRLRVLQIPSVARLIGFNGQPAALPDEQIAILRSGLSERLRVQPHPFLTVGRRVRITNGPLAGLEGSLQRRKGKLHVVLSLDLIQRSVRAAVDLADIEPLS